MSQLIFIEYQNNRNISEDFFLGLSDEIIENFDLDQDSYDALLDGDVSVLGKYFINDVLDSGNGVQEDTITVSVENDDYDYEYEDEDEDFD